MSKIVIAVCALLALLAGAWWWSQGPASAPPTASESPVAVDKAPPPTATVVDAHEAVASTPNERTAAAPTNEALPIPESATWCDVLVVDHETGNAVAAADVTYYDESCSWRVMDLSSQAEREPLLRNPERIAARFGWRTRSDASGKVRVHFAKSHAIVYGYQGGRFGTLTCERAVPPGGFRLELTPDRMLRVQVLDAAAQPLPGMPVRIEPLQLTHRGAVSNFDTPSESPDGIATFAHLQLSKQLDGKPAAGSWRARLVMPGLEREAVEFDFSAPPTAPIVLRLPPTGKLALRVVHEGAPLAPAPGISLRSRSDDGNAAADLGPLEQLESMRQPGADGWVLFDRVPIASTFVASVQIGMATLRQDVIGPTSPGQRVEVELSTAGKVVDVTGRVLDANGVPLAAQTVQAAIASNVFNGGVGAQTDTEGRFHLLIGTQPNLGANAQPSVTAVALQRLEFTRRLPDGTMQSGLCAPRELQPGRNDIGDVMLSSPQLVVGGRLLADRPVNDSQVHFEVQRLGDKVGADGSPIWATERELKVSFEPDGRFQVRGVVPAGRYRIAFGGPMHLPVAPVEFVLGKADLEIPIDFGHVLHASCRLPDGVLATDVKAVLRPKTAHPMPETLDEAEQRRFGFDRFTANAHREPDDVQLQWQALPADSYTLELRANGYATAFATIDDVLVPPPAGGDARLVGIDLRNTMRTVLVHVTAASGAVNDAVVLPTPQAEEKDQAGYRVVEGAVRIPAPLGAIDLLVACRGMRPQLVRGVDQEVTVALDPWPQVSLTFVGLPALPKGMQLRARLSSAAPLPGVRLRTSTSGGSLDELLVPMTSAAVGADGTVSLPLGDGTFRVVLLLMTGSGRKNLQSITPPTVAAGTNALTVQLDADELRAAIAELQAAPALGH